MKYCMYKTEFDVCQLHTYIKTTCDQLFSACIALVVITLEVRMYLEANNPAIILCGAYYVYIDVSFLQRYLAKQL